jgi:hypothetical protein
MLAQMGVKRLGAGFRQQRFEHHVAAPAARKMLALGFSQCLDAGIAVLLVDAADRIAVPPIQTLLGHLTLHRSCNVRNLSQSPDGV